MSRSEAEWAAWAREKRAAFEVGPLVEMRAGVKLQIGFTLTLYAGLPMELPAGEERWEAGRALWQELRAVAEAAVPELERGVRAELDPPRGALLRPENQFQPEVGLTWRLFHADEYMKPADAAEREALGRIEKRLAALGLKHGHW